MIRWNTGGYNLSHMSIAFQQVWIKDVGGDLLKQSSVFTSNTQWGSGKKKKCILLNLIGEHIPSMGPNAYNIYLLAMQIKKAIINIFNTGFKRQIIIKCTVYNALKRPPYCLDFACFWGRLHSLSSPSLFFKNLIIVLARHQCG